MALLFGWTLHIDTEFRVTFWSAGNLEYGLSA